MTSRRLVPSSPVWAHGFLAGLQPNTCWPYRPVSGYEIVGADKSPRDICTSACGQAQSTGAVCGYALPISRRREYPNAAIAHAVPANRVVRRARTQGLAPHVFPSGLLFRRPPGAEPEPVFAASLRARPHDEDRAHFSKPKGSNGIAQALLANRAPMRHARPPPYGDGAPRSHADFCAIDRYRFRRVLAVDAVDLQFGEQAPRTPRFKSRRGSR